MTDSAIAAAIRAYRPGLHGVQPPAIIAEAGVNHEGSIDLARRLVDEAAEGGADAIKFQTYRAETLAVADSPAYWDTTKESTPTQRALFAKYDRLWQDDFEVLKRHCDDVGIEFMSTPFDRESVDSSPTSWTCSRSHRRTSRTTRSCVWSPPLASPCPLDGRRQRVAEIAGGLEANWATCRVCLMHCMLNYPTAIRCQSGDDPRSADRFPDTRARVLGPHGSGR